MKNNSGYSLFELLVSIAIFSMVMLGIISIMNTTSVFYRGGQQEVRLQEEAQVALNQIEELLIDLDNTMGIEANGAGAREYKMVKSDGVYGLKQDGDRLFYKKISTGGDSGWVLMAEGVKDFEITGFEYTGGERNHGDNRVCVRVDLESGKYEYSAKRDVFFRNAIENAVPYNTPDADNSASSTAEDDYDFIYTIRRGEKVNMFGEFDIVGDVDYFSESSLQANQYFNFSSTTNDTTGITSNILTVVGLTASNFSAEVKESDKIGVKGKNSKGEEVKVLLKVEPVAPVVDVPVFQLTTQSTQNAGSSKWIEYKGIDFRGYTNLTFSYEIYENKNASIAYEAGTDTKLGKNFPTSPRAFGSPFDMVDNPKINLGAKTCQNTGNLIVYQANDQCTGGNAYCEASAKYLQFKIFCNGVPIDNGLIVFRLAAHGSGFQN